MTRRGELFARLGAREYDLLVVGGGITGAGIARDAALRGLSVALVEKADLASGTSSASSKLIHGGLRYLEQGQLGLVMEGTRERALLTRLAPHLARPLPFLFPVYRSGRVGMLTIAAGMWAYDLLAAFRNYRRHRMLSRGRTMRLEPGLLARGLKGAALYYDCMTDDARLTLETALDAETHGAVVATYAEVTALTTDGGRTTGARVRDVLGEASATRDGEDGAAGTADAVEVRARVTVVAAGPWTDAVLAGQVPRPLLRPTKGSHIVLDRARLPVDHAVVLTGPRDGRVMFAIPWGPRTIVGTTDTDEAEPPDVLQASAADVRYLLDAANAHFPALRATPADVISTWSGLRPLLADDASASASDVSREHELINLDPGLLAMVGGKLTTYRLMAEQAVDRVCRKLGTGRELDPCRTKEVPLPGARDPQALRDLAAYARGLAREYALDDDVAQHLARTYGLRAPQVLAAGKDAGVRPGRLTTGLPYLVDEVAFAARDERAERLDDMLRRRTLVFLQARDQGLSACEEAAEVMADALGWSDARTQAEVARYRALVADSRRFRGEGAPAPAGAAPVEAEPAGG